MTAAKTSKTYDIIIIGGGPAGLTAGIYTSRSRLNTLLLEKAIPGGQIVNAENVENYPGFPQGIPGAKLGEAMYEQATRFGLHFLNADVASVEVKGRDKLVRTSEGDFTAPALIVASGSERMKLGVPGEEEFLGRGVSFCAICDAAFFQDKPVAVVGGGNAAVTEALHLCKYASRVTLIHRRNELRASRVEQEKVFADARIEMKLDSVVEAIQGADFVEKLLIKHLPSGKQSTLEVAGVFVSVGFRPATGFLKGQVLLDEGGSILTDEKLETKAPGVFAAGDVRHGSGRQVIGACGDGALAAINAEKYLGK